MRLADLATYIPEGRIDAEEIILAAGGTLTSARVFQRMFGIAGVSATDRNEKPTEPFERVCETLARSQTGEMPDTLIHVRALPLPFADGCSPAEKLLQSHRLLSRVKRRYEIDQTSCTGVFWALDLTRILLESGMASSVLVLAGDNLSDLHLGDRYLPGCTLMGDAYCGLILDGIAGGMQISDVTLHCYPEFSFGYRGGSAQMMAFFAAHDRLVCKALEAVGFAWQGSSCILPHNINSLAWHRFCRETGLSPERIRLGLLPTVGHCYTTDPFLLLDTEVRAANDHRPDFVWNDLALISVGMGGFVGACRLQQHPLPLQSVSSEGVLQCIQPTLC